jgi:HD superfamily phosphodiesterase
LIEDPKIRSFTEAVLLKADPFWISPASFILDTHPPDEYVQGGLVLHTKRTVRAAALMMSSADCSQFEFDCLISAALLHDITKALSRDEENDEAEIFHDAMHPYTVDNFINWCRKEDILLGEADRANTLEIPEEYIATILRLIRCSHGMWSPIPETVPDSYSEKILHMADLVASTLHRLIDGTEVVMERWKLNEK